jgi:hypothetical protein
LLERFICISKFLILGRSRFCTLPDLACIKRNNVKIKTSKITYNNYLRANTFNTQTSDYTTKCKCYPQCDEISYSYQQDQQPLQTSNVGLGSNVSILRVYFGHVSCMKLLRSVLITWELIVGKNCRPSVESDGICTFQHLLVDWLVYVWGARS